MKKILCIVLSVALLSGTTGCNMSNTGKGALIGGGGGAALGSVVGAIAGNGKGAAIGAAVGAAVGAGAGALIGNKMDKQAKELEQQISDAKVETVVDTTTNLTSIKVTFDGGIFFDTGKSNLSTSAQKSLTQFASSLINNPQTNVQICGHTDNTGSREVNDKLSLERANSVRTYLCDSGVDSSRLTSEGYAWDYPVADNSTAAGRAQNRRVEIYITANEDMINAANNGTLQ